MPRRSKIDRARNASGGATRTPTPPSPFGALAALRKPANASATAGPRAAATRSDGATPTPEPDPAAEDAALFLRTVGAVERLRDSGRKEVEQPRPAPLPRRQRPEDLASTEPDKPRRHDPLAEAYADVTPLRDSGRVALGPPPSRHPYPRAEDGSPAASMPLPAAVLPPEAEHADPAELFRLVMRGAQPLDQRNRAELDKPLPPPAPLKREADERSALDESLEAPLTFEDRLDMGDEAAFLRPGLPRRVLSDLRRGRWVLQGEIDLHGHTREEARAALAHFLVASLQQGRRCIRVIHGKGLGSPGKVSILKQLSRGWLAQREEILAFCQAGPHDGGAGALLVLMRAPNVARR